MKQFLFFASVTLLFSCTNAEKGAVNEQSTALAADTLAVQPVDTSLVQSADALVVAPEDTLPKDELHDSDYGIVRHRLAIRNGLPTWFLKIHPPDGKIYLYRDEAEKELIQSVALSSDLDYNNEHYSQGPETYLGAEDYNFDHYKDLKVLRVTGTGGYWYDIHLYDRVQRKFVLHNQLSELASPTADSVNKTVSYHNVGGMGGSDYISGICRWENNQLATVRREEQTLGEEGPEVIIRTVYVRDGNQQLKLASKVRITREDKESELQCLLEGEWAEFDKYPNLLFTESADQVRKQDGRNGKCE
ncbi:MAG: hypothetical protein H7Z75_10405 [Ferruginibacter sp.]|nr:hypothetical protein [Cytophagales bacterium]